MDIPPFSDSLFSKSLISRSWINPISLVIIGSLFLSAIAIYDKGLPDRDGMLYIETASIFLEEGLFAARANFDWVFFPVCIGTISKITGLGTESSAYILSALLLAGVCATLVHTVQVQFPAATWYACLIVLTLPALNGQRSVIIRELGCWLFCLQALLFALHWQRNPTYEKGLIVQLLLLSSALFRVEAIVFFVSLALWQIFTKKPWKQRLKHLSMLITIPLGCGVIFIPLLASGKIEVAGRIIYYASAANPAILFTRFHSVAEQMGNTVLNHYSADESGAILFFGLLSTIIIKFITHNGILLVPFTVFLWGKRLRQNFIDWQPQLYFFIVYAVVLVIFITFQLFISGRYIILLNILTIPLVTLGLQEMFERYPRWRFAFLSVLILAALANVVSFSPPKTQYREAGQWLAARPEIADRTYIEDSRTRYFAGAAFRTKQKLILLPKDIKKAVDNNQYDYIVIGLTKRNTGKTQWINSLNFEEAERFSSKSGDSVLILRHKSLSP